MMYPNMVLILTMIFFKTKPEQKNKTKRTRIIINECHYYSISKKAYDGICFSNYERE